MEETMNVAKRVHKLILTNRKNCFVGGVLDVLSFDLGEVLLETEQGMLLIKGSNLHVSKLLLEKGEVEIDGIVDSMTYSEVESFAEKSAGLIGKLFK